MQNQERVQNLFLISTAYHHQMLKIVVIEFIPKGFNILLNFQLSSIVFSLEQLCIFFMFQAKSVRCTKVRCTTCVVLRQFVRHVVTLATNRSKVTTSSWSRKTTNATTPNATNATSAIELFKEFLTLLLKTTCDCVYRVLLIDVLFHSEDNT